MKKIFLLSMLFAFMISCSKSKPDINDVEYFKANIQAGMTEAEILNKFGNPDADLGSGIHIYEYHMNDGTRVIIGCTDKIMYARHVDGNGFLIYTIL